MRDQSPHGFEIGHVVRHALGDGIVSELDGEFVVVHVDGMDVATLPANLEHVPLRRTVSPEALASLDRDDIATWVAVATDAGLTVDPIRAPAEPPNPIAQDTGD